MWPSREPPLLHPLLKDEHPPQRMPVEDASTSRWRRAFAECAPTLEALARAGDEELRLATRAWWVVCMGGRVPECKSVHATWKSEASAGVRQQLRPSDTEAVVSLASWPPLAQCVLDCGRAVGVEVSHTLAVVEAEGIKQQAGAEWQRAVAEVAPLRSRLQQELLQNRLAPSRDAMEVDELRVCQVWTYALASRLEACRAQARDFATAAGMRNANQPLVGYDEARWDPHAPAWQDMELCVTAEAERASTDCDSEWRGVT